MLQHILALVFEHREVVANSRPEFRQVIRAEPDGSKDPRAGDRDAEGTRYRCGGRGDIGFHNLPGGFLGDGETFADLGACVAYADSSDTFRVLVGG